MANTTKRPSDLDGNQALQNAFNEVDSSFTTNGFLTGKVGHKITLALSTTTVSNDTETYTFFDGATQLYQIQLVYTDTTRALLLSAERIS